jgi:uncharacterized protein YqeY
MPSLGIGMSNLIESIKSQLTLSIKEKNEVKKGILRVILGDLSTYEARLGKTATDEEVQKIIKKIMEGNLETLSYLKFPYLKDAEGSLSHEQQVAKLNEENAILDSFLPKTLSVLEIKDVFNFSSTCIVNDIKSAKNDGQATGIAIKWFKQFQIAVENNDIAAVVREMRSVISLGKE